MMMTTEKLETHARGFSSTYFFHSTLTHSPFIRNRKPVADAQHQISSIHNVPLIYAWALWTLTQSFFINFNEYDVEKWSKVAKSLQFRWIYIQFSKLKIQMNKFNVWNISCLFNWNSIVFYRLYVVYRCSVKKTNKDDDENCWISKWSKIFNFRFQCIHKMNAINRKCHFIDLCG